MSGVLVVAEHVRGMVSEATLGLVTVATELDGPVTVLVIGRDPAALASQLALAGIDEILLVSVPSDEFDGDLARAALKEVLTTRQPRVTLVPHTVNGMAVGPSVAAGLGLGFAADVFGLRLEEGRLVARRALYGGKITAEIEFPDAEQVLVTVRPLEYPPPSPGPAPPTAEQSVTLPASRTRHRRLVETESTDDVDLTAANFILAIGRGVEDEANIEEFAELATAMGATLASSRPLVDSGWLPASRQVGQSGRTVTPAVYLAFGISGAIQHLVGMKGSGTVIAVNTDPEAPIFAVADYAAVADMFDVAAELRKLHE